MPLLKAPLRYSLWVTLLQVSCTAIGIWWFSHLNLAFERRAVLEEDWKHLQTGVSVADTHRTCFDNALNVCDCISRQPGTASPHVQWLNCNDEANLLRSKGILQIDGAVYAGIAQRRGDGGLDVQYLVREVPSITSGSRGNWFAAFAIAILLVLAISGVVTYLAIDRAHDRWQRQRTNAESRSLAQIEMLQSTRDGIIFGLAKLAEFRDEDTGSHLDRIAAFAMQLAQALMRDPRGQGLVDRDFVRMIGVSAVLHDIGKVAIPDSILLKPGPLTVDERAIMQRHAEVGASCIAQIERRLGNSNYLRMAGEIAAAHHERWDGQGYPLGLRGQEIPLSARIVAIADVYDALASPRVYKPPMSHKDCVQIIADESGKHFDPLLVSVFLSISSQVEETAMRYQSHLSPPAPPPMPLPRWNLARENEELVATGDVSDGHLWLNTAT